MRPTERTATVVLAALTLLLSVGRSQETAAVIRDIAYGPHPAQRLDVYLPAAPVAVPTPVVFVIHGGGWTGGDKKWMVTDALKSVVLPAGCAIVSVNYRLIKHAHEDGVFPPVMAPLGDSRRALQFVRAHAAAWKMDPERIALFGGSAGAFTTLWIALSPDAAEPEAVDPVARQSTRVMVVGVVGAQTSIDPRQMRAWVPGITYGAHAFGVESFDAFLARRDAFADWYPRLSPASLLSADDPPIYLYYGFSPDEPDQDENFHTHSPGFGIGFAKLAEERGAQCTLSYPGFGPAASREDILRTLVRTLIDSLPASR